MRKALLNATHSSSVRVPGILIRETAALIVRNGRSSVTVSEILEFSGVSRGAMFHHFYSKQDLIDATFASWLHGFSLDVEQKMRTNGLRHGAFTNAYVESVVEGCRRHDVAMLSALIIRLDLTQLPALQWIEWMKKKLATEPSEADDPALKSARLAADGLWLGSLSCPAPANEPKIDIQAPQIPVQRCGHGPSHRLV
ncbi:TPA: TetR/AcrR family transcriptional regulator [Stenotrophomonas maltophilia]|nr:TetR/AcrR family transcriptional regulator [Stenotrophomonas maltophilia]